MITEDLEFQDIHRMLSVPETTPMGISRRRFLQAAALGAGAFAAAPYFQAAAWADPVKRTDGILVLIQLGGGNDALNMVVPTGDSAYYAKRGALAIQPTAALPLVSGWGLHPALTKLKARYDAGQVAVVRGIGVPNPDLSHFTSMATWMHGSADSLRTNNGWLGRWLDGLDRDNLRGVAIGGSTPLHLVGSATRATALPTSGSSIFGANRSNASDARMFDAVSSFGYQPTGLGKWGDAIAVVENQTMELSAEVSPLFAPALSGGSLTKQLTLAARLINSNLGVRVIGVTLDGFDTHTDEVAAHNKLFADFDAAIDAFYATLAPGWQDAVTLATFSEFGRRVQFNGSGTDHGTAASAFVIGTKVAGGMMGDPPSLTALDRNGNLVKTVDYRSLYGTILDSWLAADSTEVLGASYPALPLFNGTPLSAEPPPPPPPPPPPVPVVAPTPTAGYFVVTAGGAVVNFGRSGNFGADGQKSPVAGMATTPDRKGVWLVRQDGAVLPYGTAKGYGSMAGKKLNQPMRGIAASPTGRGYWLLGGDGGVFSYGDARFFGSTGGIKLNQPVVGMAAHPSGGGYWFVAADGGIFNYGNAGFFGSTGSIRLNKPVVGMAATPSGDGYWLVASDGGIFCYGDAVFYGSTGSMRLNSPVVGMAATPSGEGYWLVAGDGGIFGFGDADFHGSLGGSPPKSGVVGIVG
jgi:uncharacterized protein (DUF1501 family)